MPDATGVAPDFDIMGLAAGLRLRAAAFIVTLYGDAVVPRGGEVWIGTIIETCAQIGISETLVRTAVSRLVAADQLEGHRKGRRSYYRLTQAAHHEFEAAARLIYGPPDPCDWRFTMLGSDGGDAIAAQLERQGHVRLRAQMMVGPARGPLPRGALGFQAGAEGAQELLPEFAAQLWDLTPHAQAYTTLIDRFAPLEGPAPLAPPAQALALRLMLVHAWRSALLRDPRLPAAALPADWPGFTARRIFARLYAALTPKAESHVVRAFLGANGALGSQGEQVVKQRLEQLKAEETRAWSGV